MSYYLRIIILLLLTALPVLIGAFRYHLLNKSGRIFFYLCVLSLLTEILASYAAIKFGNNIAVYNISNILQMLFTCLYFNDAVVSLKKRHIGLILGALSVITGVLNIVFLQPVHQIADNFLLYESILIIALCMIALWPRFKVHYKPDPTREADFWFIVILGMNWAITYFLFSLVNFYTLKSPAIALNFTWGLYLTSILSSVAIAMVFFRYSKLTRHV